MSDEQQAAVPAGWFPAGDVPGMQRYWDGNGWSDQIRAVPAGPPVPPPVGFSPASVKDDPSYAWALALLPLVVSVLILTVPKAVNSAGAWIGFYAVTLLLCALDQRRLKAKGVTGPAPAAILLVPVYLIQRTRFVGSIAAIPILWFVTFGASVLVGAIAPGAYTYDQTTMNEEIGAQLSAQVGGAVTVDCPPAHHEFSGDTITCSVVDTAGTTASVLVTFGKGSYTFVLQR